MNNLETYNTKIYPSKTFIRFVLVLMNKKLKPIDESSPGEKINVDAIWDFAQMDAMQQSGGDNLPLQDMENEYRPIIDFVLSFLSSDDCSQPDLKQLGLSPATISDLAEHKIVSPAQLELTNETYLLRCGLKRGTVNEVKLLLNQGFPLGKISPL